MRHVLRTTRLDTAADLQHFGRCDLPHRSMADCGKKVVLESRKNVPRIFGRKRWRFRRVPGEGDFLETVQCLETRGCLAPLLVGGGISTLIDDRTRTIARRSRILQRNCWIAADCQLALDCAE